MLAGDHRVQRVPATEKNGRRHSSHVIVVVLDGTAPANDITIRKDDVRVDTYRSSGAGGQHRNKTDSAVRLTHTPTGVVVTATEERSQHENRKVAWERLHTVLADQEARGAHTDTNTDRRQHFTGGREWVWCGWRDEVRRPDGKRGSMRRVLSGRLGTILD